MSRAISRQKPRGNGPPLPDQDRLEIGRPPAYARIEAVLRLLPTDGTQIASSRLVRRLYETLGLPRRTAIRWLKEAEEYIPEGHHYPMLEAVRSGRQRLYGFNLTGFMDKDEVEWFLRGAPIGFLREAPGLVEQYAESGETMTLFWEQASSALTLSMERLIGAAQSVTFAQVHDRAAPSADVARVQADVLTDVFVRPWVRELVAAQHRFLEIERATNRKSGGLPDGRLAAPSPMDALREGWSWANGPDGAAHKTWVPRMSGAKAGPWGAFLERVQTEQAVEMKRLSDRARSEQAGDGSPSP